MKKPTKIYDAHDIVVVPFPFVDTLDVKHRPALILSSNSKFNNQSGSSIMAMITTSFHKPWPFDVEICDLISAGLPVKSIIRMKLFTLDNRLVIKRIGKLSKNDQKVLSMNFEKLFP